MLVCFFLCVVISKAEKSYILDISMSNCVILDFSSGKLTVLVDSYIVVQLIVNETKPWEIVYTIDCPSRVLHASVTGSILSVVDSDHSIRILSNLSSENFHEIICNKPVYSAPERFSF